MAFIKHTQAIKGFDGIGQIVLSKEDEKTKAYEKLFIAPSVNHDGLYVHLITDRGYLSFWERIKYCFRFLFKYKSLNDRNTGFYIVESDFEKVAQIVESLKNEFK